MRGSIEELPSGKWRLTVSMGKDPESGKYIKKRRTVGGTKTQAKKDLTAMLSALDTGIYVEPTKETVGEFLERWLRDYVDVKIEKPKVRVYYRTIVNTHLIPALGRTELAKLTPGKIQQYCREALTSGRVNRKGEKTGLPLSSTTVQGHHRALHLALECAVKESLIARNICDATDPPKRRRKEMATWTPAECVKFLQAARETRYYALFATAIYTGLRMGELLGLRWKDVDLDGATLTVQQTLEKSGREPRFGTPKTARSRRTQPLTTDLVIILKAWKAKQNEERLLLGPEYRDYGLVFTIPGGGAVNGDNLRKREFARLTERAEVPAIRFHDLRHSFASLLLENNTDLKMVSELMGHASISVTADIYGHLRMGPKREVVNVLGRVLAHG